MKNVFLVTSGINIDYGIFDSSTRFYQTIDTFESIRTRCPNSKIFLLEGTPYGLSDQQLKDVRFFCDGVLLFNNDPVINLFHKEFNIQQLKSPSEVYIVKRFLEMQNFIRPEDNVFKISGRYTLNSMFNIDNFNNEITFGPKFPCCKYFNTDTGKEFEPISDWQLRTRFYGFKGYKVSFMIETYEKMLDFFHEVYNNNSFTDVEHVTYKFLNEHATQIPRLGLTGVFADRNERIFE